MLLQVMNFAIMAFGVKNLLLDSNYEEYVGPLSKISEQKLRNTMVQTALRKHTEKLMEFGDKPYVSLSIDEGKANDSNNFYFSILIH